MRTWKLLWVVTVPALWCIGCAGGKSARIAPEVSPEPKALTRSCEGTIDSITIGDSLTWPSVVLENEQLAVTVYVPNHRYGYYRSSRFDWSGMIGHVKHRGHVFYTDWQTPHDAGNPEHGIGPAEEFGMEDPLGYEQAKPGEGFLKIGVGILRKSAEPEKYFFNHPYDFVTPPLWSIRCGGQWIEFAQDIALEPHAYHYVKRIALEGTRLVIEHTLENTGSAEIDTRVYCHNFTNIDGTPMGPSYRVEFPFDPMIDSSTLAAMEAFARLEDGAIRFVKELGTKSVWANLKNLDGTAGDNGATVINTATGGFVKIQGDRAPALYNFWATGTAACPEPFVPVTVGPGEQAEWTITLTFGTTGEGGE